MATHSDTYERSEHDVRKENRRLVKDIVSYCSQRDYKKHNVLLIGQIGSGKSSIINTLLKVIIDEYIPRAKAGSGDVKSYTLQLKCYESCGTMATDFERRDEQQREHANRRTRGRWNELTHNELMWTVRDQLPNIFDAAGMKNKNDDSTKEILRLLIGGHISSNTNMEELMRLQKMNGLGYLPMTYKTFSNDNKISMILFACSCTSPIPYNLIKCVREVLQEVDPSTASNKYATDVFVLITKYDQVKTVYDYKETISKPGKSESPMDPDQDNKINEAVSTISIDKFNEVRGKITAAFMQTGTATQSQLNWASYNDTIGHDNVYVDNTALKLLKVLTKPLHIEERPSLQIPTYKSNFSCLLIFLAFVVVCLGLLWFVSFGGVQRPKYQRF